MKKYLFSLLAFIALTFGAQASHITGGDIQYRYIGDSTGIAHQYEIFLRVYRDCGPLSMSTFIPSLISVRSTCYPTQTMNLTRILSPNGNQEWNPDTYTDCVDSALVPCIAINKFKGVITLPGQCSDFVIYWQSCCRPASVTNLANPTGDGFYFEAKLNNFLGNNSSPEFVSEPARAFCINQNFNWVQGVIEPDGDSVKYKLISARDWSAGAPVGLTYTGGFTPLQPMTTNPTNSLTLDAQSGLLNFTPSAVETDVIALEVEEYRFDTVYQNWVLIGSSNRELIAAVGGNCSQAAQDGVTLDFSDPTVYPDPVNGLPTVDYTCLDSSVTLHFATKLDCSTISPDGTDFRLTAPTGQPIPVKEIISNCDVNNETDQLLLKLYKPLAFNGKYFLYSKMGNDGNTLLNKCGFAMTEFDTIQLNVKNCFTTNIDMKNVTIVDDEYPRVEWELDTIGTPTEPFPKYLVDQYKVFRSDDNGATYNLLWTLNNNYKQMWFNDQSLSYDDVDMQHYKYQIEVIVSSISAGTTRNINSIWLRTTDGQELKANDSIQWSHYPAWPNPDFTVYLGKRDGNGNWIDAVHTPPGSSGQMNPTNDSIYYMQNEGLTPGTYRVCAKAEYPGGGGPYEAWSNCLQFNINEPPPEPVDTPTTVVIPNVITPNADDMNDYFDIKNLNTWNTSRSVKIFNRWGKMVYQNDFYRNEDPWYGTDQSGKALADGVYFYVIEVYNAPSGTRKEHKGQVTIIGSTN